MIRVLIVDDSPVAQQALAHIFASDSRLQVIGTVANGEAALDYVAAHKPDVVTMDIHMPVMDGFEATRRIMETHPVPIVMVSAHYKHGEADKVFRALDEGALTIMARPVGPGHALFALQAKELCDTVRLMAGVRVVRRLRRTPRGETPAALPAGAEAPNRSFELVAIGASTGGPPVIRTLLAGLPRHFPLPIVMVQHIAPGFVRGMADWLNETSLLPVSVGRSGMDLAAGHVYLAPDALHMGVDAHRRLTLSDTPPDYGVRPSAAHLFDSVAAHVGRSAIAVLLTGMGRDGAAELKRLRQRGAMTIVQNRETCTVFGMPGEAVRLGAAIHELAPEQIAALLVRLTGTHAVAVSRQ